MKKFVKESLGKLKEEINQNNDYQVTIKDGVEREERGYTDLGIEDCSEEVRHDIEVDEILEREMKGGYE